MKNFIKAMSEISEKHIDELKDIGKTTPTVRRSYKTVLIAATLAVLILSLSLFAAMGSAPPAPSDIIPQSTINDSSDVFVSETDSADSDVSFEVSSGSNESSVPKENSSVSENSFAVEDSSQIDDNSIYDESSLPEETTPFDPSQYDENGAAFTAQQMADILTAPSSEGLTSNYQTFYFDSVADIQTGDLPNGMLPILIEDDWDYTYSAAGLGGNIEFLCEINGETIVIPSDSTVSDVYSAAKTFLPVCQERFGFDYSDIVVIESKTSDFFYVYYLDATLDIPYFENGRPAMTCNSVCYLRIGSNMGDSDVYTLCGIYYKAENGSVKEGERYATISLEEAEVLLNSGYVFGGHGCPLCMEMNLPVDFSDYDLVGIEYVSGYDSDWNPTNEHYPFYAFYKEIYEGIFARTYVPAFRVSGLEEYFESQINMH